MRVDSLSSNLPTALIRPQKATRGRAKRRRAVFLVAAAAV